MRTVPPAATPAERDALAPTGALRVGVYAGSPTSYVAGESGSPRGVGYLLGRALALCLGTPFEPVIRPRNTQLLQAVGAAEIDLVFTNATGERAKFIDFSGPLLTLDKGVLVPTSSAAFSLGDVTAEGKRIGFTAGSTTAGEFGLLYPEASLVAVTSLSDAAFLLTSSALDGFATNKAILCQLADEMGGGRILDEAWGSEHLALGIPLQRGAGLAFLQRFAAWATESGVVDDAVSQSSLRGAKPYAAQ
ncbi:transporter substrate-binding domain-containing protein [Ramlibacter sp. PS3R-8]|uniref:transporter substrate-binding domain-containing protein n=1 Tax=Ramlibacter sp. PS3R-8 TaxID=3133437 RepID=UPI003098A3CC